MRIVCQQMILMKYHALFVIYEKKKQQNFKLSSAAKYTWRLISNVTFQLNAPLLSADEVGGI